MITQTKTNMKFPAKERSDAILEFLSTHMLISRNALCTMVGYDVSNLQHCMDGKRAIPAKHLPEFERVLKAYGYTPPV